MKKNKDELNCAIIFLEMKNSQWQIIKEWNIIQVKSMFEETASDSETVYVVHIYRTNDEF